MMFRQSKDWREEIVQGRTLVGGGWQTIGLTTGAFRSVADTKGPKTHHRYPAWCTLLSV
jgi:hypothetical protein